MGCPHRNTKPRCRRRPRRPRPRICLRKGCGHTYLPRRWNQRYCQDPECQRQVRRWQAARRQARRRRNDATKTQHAQAQRRAGSVPSLRRNHRRTLRLRRRGHAAKIFLPLFLCARPGCYEPPLTSVRNPAHFCGPACRQAVQRVRDRERKWRSRKRFRTQQARLREYAAAHHRRCGPPDGTAPTT